MSIALKVKDLCKTYITNKRQNNILRNVNFAIEQGEIVAVMGPSGSGKSTLLYTVSGMDQLTSGNVEFFGREIGGLSQKELSNMRLKEMGFIFQQMYMLKNLSIYDNIILSAYQSEGSNKASRKVINEYAKQLMRKTGIIDVAENDIAEVSGGQLQRACICRSLINHPKMIFADEPTGSLNKQTSTEVMDEIIRVNREGTTVMLVTHDARIAAKTDRVLYISDGNIQGEYRLDKYKDESALRSREKELNNWLIDMGW